MRPHGQEADAEFMGRNIQELRGLPTTYFEERYYEGDDAIRPSFLLPESLVEVPQVYAPTTEKHERTTKKDVLPIDAHETEIMAAFASNRYIVLLGETGSGKSTRLPQIALKYGFDEILQTQPRRPAVRNVASRIEHDLAQDYGVVAASKLVKYQTAIDAKGLDTAPIKILTDGLFLAHEVERIAREPNKKVCIILDEIHEGNCNVEIGAALALRAARDNPNITVVFSSATMDVDNTLDYVNRVTGVEIQPIEVEGRTYHVERRIEPESDVVAETIKASRELITNYDNNPSDANGILIFLPGKAEIKDVIDELRKRLPRDIAKRATILPLHSKLTPTEQTDTFKRYQGLKIIASTNLPQTSLTIPDLKYIIDSGLERRVELDQYGTQGLVLHPVSRADEDQRAGRAGRVSDGVHILTRLNNETPFVSYLERDDFPTPEIMRTDIVRHVLRLAAVGIDMRELDLLHPVDESIIHRAQRKLREIGAIDGENIVTPLGKRMNQFPVNVLSARMLVESTQFDEQTRSYMAAVAAAREVGGLQLFAPDVEKRWKALSEEQTSDALTQLDIFIAIQGMDEREMKDYDLDIHNVQRAQELYRKIAKLLGALQPELPPSKTEERDNIRYCVTAGQLTSLYKHLGSGVYQLIGKPDYDRVVSNRSTVEGRSMVIAGSPYRVEFDTADGKQEKHIVEHVTFVSAKDLGRLSVDHVQWVSDGYVIRKGRFMERGRRVLGGIEISGPEERPAEPSPKLQEEIIRHIMTHPGYSLRELHAIKKELERLNRRAKSTVPQLTEDTIRSIVVEATTVDTTNRAIVDQNIRELVADKGITLDTIISPEERAEIYRTAPDEITVQVDDETSVIFDIKYRNKVPLIYQYNRSDVMKLREELFLAEPDGRQIKFMHYSDGNRSKRACTLIELQERLRNEIRLS